MCGTITKLCTDRTIALCSAQDVEQLVLALSNEVYPQVADLSSYLTQLSTSLQRQVLQIEHTKQLLVAPDGEATDPEYIKLWNVYVAALPKGPLADNRDFKLVPNYQPRDCAGVEELLAVGPKVEVRKGCCSYGRGQGS